ASAENFPEWSRCYDESVVNAPVLREAWERLSLGERLALATLVEPRRSTPPEVGDQIPVRRGGASLGTPGGRAGAAGRGAGGGAGRWWRGEGGVWSVAGVCGCSATSPCPPAAAGGALRWAALCSSSSSAPSSGRCDGCPRGATRRLGATRSRWGRCSKGPGP